MKQIKQIEDLDIIAELKEMPNQGILWEIIENQITGRIYSLNNNAIVIIENNCHDPFVFIAGNISSRCVEKVKNLVNNIKFPMVYCSPKNHHIFIKQGWGFHLRVQLELRKTYYENIVCNIKNKITNIQSTDLFNKCLWYEEKVQLYGSLQNFMKYGRGFVLALKNSTVISEVYASIGNGYGEIGIATKSEHRGKGYAGQIAAYLIKKLLDDNIIPQWSCDVDNSASIGTALKLGFEIDNYYVLLVPNHGNICRK